MNTDYTIISLTLAIIHFVYYILYICATEPHNLMSKTKRKTEVPPFNNGNMLCRFLSGLWLIFTKSTIKKYLV